MTIPLRPLSPRPELLVEGPSLPVDPGGAQVGVAGPLGRGRVVRGLPTNQTGPVQLVPPVALRDSQSCLLADPSGAVIGVDGVWVHRVIYGTRTLDTRGL